MPSTGQACQESGIYKCTKSGCGNTIPLAKGNIFPPCGRCYGTQWVLVQKA